MMKKYSIPKDIKLSKKEIKTVNIVFEKVMKQYRPVFVKLQNS